MDAQLSHSDPNKLSSAYNHAKYVEPRRRMMQDWADRLDLLEQGQLLAIIGSCRAPPSTAPEHAICVFARTGPILATSALFCILQYIICYDPAHG
ncbi:hypothetical protein Y886_13660 [Xanthomonas hyacinthi DSM 19077]|nr:hypothetical protein Y886_13660 [Xanthomonas hyacinthi DSM 19077]